MGHPLPELDARLRQEAFLKAVEARRARRTDLGAQLVWLADETRQLAESVPELVGKGRRPLGPREREAVALLIQGFTNEQIAARMAVSTETVKSHVKHALAKTGARNRVHLATCVAAAGIEAGREEES